MPQCRKSVDNVVECRGLARGASGVFRGEMFTLPEGRLRLAWHDVIMMAVV
jgi:hypothetical protein